MNENYFDMYREQNGITFQTIDELYDFLYHNPIVFNGDNAAFYQHMPTLRLLCRDKVVVECGTRYGTSTVAIAAARPISHLAIDIERKPTIDLIEALIRQEVNDFHFITASDLDTYIPPCDVLFIDTKHNYNQLRAELFGFGNNALEYIVLHDTVSFGHRDEFPDGSQTQGLLPAVYEFLNENPHWKFEVNYNNCNGLGVLHRV